MEHKSKNIFYSNDNNISLCSSFGIKKENYEIKNYIRLFRSIIAQVVIDIKTESKKRRNIKSKEEALKWFYNNPKEFEDICYKANLSPNKIRNIINNHLNKSIN